MERLIGLQSHPCGNTFVSDCLETSVEIGESNRDIFIERGGKSFDLVPSLNDDDSWADAVIEILDLS